MPVRRVAANEKVDANRRRVALERGPLVYCLEAIDNDGSVYDLVLPPDAPLTHRHQADLLGGLPVITGTAQRAVGQADGEVQLQAAPIRAIPYYAWAHRQMGEMAVWIALDAGTARIKPSPTIASSSRATASHVWQLDSVDALNDQREPANSGDHSIARHTWWDHRGTAEWVQYDFSEPQMVSQVDVYWFDDTGRGQCRVPAKWQIDYRDGDQWRSVTTNDPHSVDKDRYNVVTFQPVKTTALRLQVQLQPEFSGGILEWRVR
jgi:hypothetical protein